MGDVIILFVILTDRVEMINLIWNYLPDHNKNKEIHLNNIFVLYYHLKFMQLLKKQSI